MAIGQDSVITGEAYICPSEDGGYCLLTVPCHSTLHTLFDNVSVSFIHYYVLRVISFRIIIFSQIDYQIKWSTEGTCSDQINALTNAGYPMCIFKKYKRYTKEQLLHILMLLIEIRGS